MKALLLVDGYNILGAWPAVKKNGWDVDEARDRLLALLADYAGFEDVEIILVFDGYKSERKLRSEQRAGGVTVVFTKQGETADQYIEALAGRTPRYRPLQVATSDYVEQMLVLGRGATRLSARELLGRMQHVRLGGMDRQRAGGIIKKNPLEAHLTDEQREKLEKLRRQ